MELQRIVIDSRPARVLYLDEHMIPVPVEQAVRARVLFDDGAAAWYSLRAESKALSADDEEEIVRVLADAIRNNATEVIDEFLFGEPKVLHYSPGDKNYPHGGGRGGGSSKGSTLSSKQISDAASGKSIDIDGGVRDYIAARKDLTDAGWLNNDWEPGDDDDDNGVGSEYQYEKGNQTIRLNRISDTKLRIGGWTK